MAAHAQGDGSGHYGGWHVMEAIERYSDYAGAMYDLLTPHFPVLLEGVNRG